MCFHKLSDRNNIFGLNRKLENCCAGHTSLIIAQYFINKKMKKHLHTYVLNPVLLLFYLKQEFGIFL